MTDTKKALDWFNNYVDDLEHHLQNGGGSKRDDYGDILIQLKYIEIIRNSITTWRLITNAPKDGTKILLSIPEKYVKNGNLRKKKQPWICIGFWKSLDQDAAIAAGVNEARMKLAYKHGGYWTNHFRGEQPLRGEPSHFMLLPDAPSGDE